MSIFVRLLTTDDIILHLSRCTYIYFKTTMPFTFWLVVATISFAKGLPDPGSEGKGLELLVLHNNDMHARFDETSELSGVCSQVDRDAGKCYGGFARVAHLVKKYRREEQEGVGPPVLFLNAGDTYAGTAWFTLYKSKIVIDGLNGLHPDAVSLGNHEFDQGVSGLTPLIENLKSPVLAANLDLSKVPELAAEPNLHKSIVFNISGVKVGVIGYLTPDTKFLSFRNDIEYIDEVVALNEEAGLLKKNGVEIIIALGHSGWTTDLRIAREVEGIDLVIGGHTNTFLWNGTEPDTEKITGPYPTMVKQASGRMVPVVQAYAYTKYLGKLHLVFDDQGELLNYNGSPILLDNSIPQDPHILHMFDKYRENFTAISEEVVGSSSVFLEGNIPCRTRECNLGNLVADAMAHQYLTINKQVKIPPIAIVMAGSLRTSIPKSSNADNITLGQIMEVMPFGNRIVALKMTGNILLQALEHSVAFAGSDKAGSFLQVSGLRITYDLSNAPGKRVVRALARCQNCDSAIFSEIEDNNEYIVVMADFVAMGGGKYTMFANHGWVKMPWNDATCLADYIRANSPVYAAAEGRITVLPNNRLRTEVVLTADAVNVRSCGNGVMFLIFINVLNIVVISKW